MVPYRFLLTTRQISSETQGLTLNPQIKLGVYFSTVYLKKKYSFKNHAEGGLASNLMWKYDWLLQYQVTFYIRIW